jgi:hypothetical protein
MTTKHIYIDWDGPYTLDELEELDDPRIDYGLYQVYGSHPLYGEEVLLYLGATGATGERTFGARLAEEQNYWEVEEDFQPLIIYVGRLMGVVTPTNAAWEEEMDLALRLLTYAHAPVFNAREVAAMPDDDLKDVHVVNWGEYLDLAPEVSGHRYLYKFPDTPEYSYYGKQGEH